MKKFQWKIQNIFFFFIFCLFNCLMTWTKRVYSSEANPIKRLSHWKISSFTVINRLLSFDRHRFIVINHAKCQYNHFHMAFLLFFFVSFHFWLTTQIFAKELSVTKWTWTNYDIGLRKKFVLCHAMKTYLLTHWKTTKHVHSTFLVAQNQFHYFSLWKLVRKV